MKKLISIILIYVLVLSVAIMPAFAETNESEYLYRDKFIEYYVEGKEVHWEYKEVYYHYDESKQVDWSLVYGIATNISKPSYQYLKFTDFVLTAPHFRGPFDLQYAVYDVKKKAFVDLVDGYDELWQYEGLIDVLRELDRSVLLGDSDKDGQLSIMDATGIQMELAGLEHLWDSYLDCRGVSGRFLDFDNDGELSVLDATAIQLKLAGIE